MIDESIYKLEDQTAILEYFKEFLEPTKSWTLE